jgi:pimeloyl-ACP methyl ester carboxylesterase
MFRIFFVGLIFICISCSTESKVEYEYLTKNKSFVENLNIESNSAFISLSDGFTFYSQDNEDVATTPVLLIHGFSVPSYIWDPTFTLLSKKGYHVISLDLYGRGFSENVDSAYTDELLANQVIELMKNLEIDSAKLVGLSNGGRVISKVAELRPEMVHSLIYVASSGFRLINEVEDKFVTEQEVEEFINNRYPTISKGQLDDFKYPENHKRWDQKYEELLKYKGFAKALLSTSKNHYTMDAIHKNIQQSDIPVYTIWGDSDQVVIYDEFEKRIDAILPKRKEFFILESGHLPHMENPEQFNNILLSILNKDFED